jgi:hypothetical protein
MMNITVDGRHIGIFSCGENKKRFDVITESEFVV